MTSQGLQMSESNYFIEYDSELFQFSTEMYLQKCTEIIEMCLHIFGYP